LRNSSKKLGYQHSFLVIKVKGINYENIKVNSSFFLASQNNFATASSSDGSGADASSQEAYCQYLIKGMGDGSGGHKGMGDGSGGHKGMGDGSGGHKGMGDGSGGDLFESYLQCINR